MPVAKPKTTPPSKRASKENPDHWFLTLQKVGATFGLRLLQSQTLLEFTLTGKESVLVDTKLPVLVAATPETQVNLTPYSMGTIFSCTNLTKRTSSYTAEELQLIDVKGLAASEINLPLAAPTVVAEFNNYLAEVTDSLSPLLQAEKGTFLQEAVADKSMKPPTVAKDGFYIDQLKWYQFLRNVDKGVHTLITGHSGTGKTKLVYLLAKASKKKLYAFDMSTMKDPVSSLIGVHRLNSKGHSEFDYSPFVEAIQGPNIVLCDEINRAPVDTNNLLLPCLDFRRELPAYLAASSDNRTIKVHPECVFLFTANMGSMYVGTVELEPALIQRTQMVEMDSLPFAAETELLSLQYSITEKDADLIVQTCTTLRDLFFDEKISVYISVRHSIQIASLIQDGWTLLTALQLVLLPLFTGTETNGERATVKNVFTTM